MKTLRASGWMLLVALMGCEKVPLTDIQAGFSLADAVWFEDEQTLFFFYRVEAQQGIEPISTIEISYRTDTEVVPWTPLSATTPVHSHLVLDCGAKQRCGSWSVKVAHQPRNVGLRLRYHPEGSLALQAPLQLSIVGSGQPWEGRSLIVYGVFDEPNLHVQWRARHQFPNLRNEEVEALGLRRQFEVADVKAGDAQAAGPDNPYWYGVPECLGRPLGWARVATSDRAVFSDREVPVSASNDSTLCGTSTVTDALGTFQAVAVARKNPQVRAAFPRLHSPVKEVTQVSFLLRPCNRVISQEHLDMQVQRLVLAGMPTFCLDDFKAPGFATSLASTLKKAVEGARMQGRDVVLNLAVHHDDTTGQLTTMLTDVLASLVIPERDKATPRLVGASVFDSYARTIKQANIQNLILWCPARLGPDLDVAPNVSTQSCPLLPDNPDLVLGPLKFNVLPILPTREQYLNYIAKYSAAQAGSMKSLTFLAPEHTTTSESFPLGDFGVATFFNSEHIDAATTDAFSYCPSPDPRSLVQAILFKVPGSQVLMPLQQLPTVHQLAPQPRYDLGLAWDSPFRLRLTYEAVLSGSLTAFTLSVPFGFKSEGEKYYGSVIWSASDFELSDVLKQCTRFCEAPTFDSAGVYNVLQPFNSTYLQQCYTPLFPKPGDGGFPRDP